MSAGYAVNYHSCRWYKTKDELGGEAGVVSFLYLSFIFHTSLRQNLYDHSKTDLFSTLLLNTEFNNFDSIW